LNFTIELLTNDDLDAITNLDRVCFGGLWSEDSYRRELASENSYFLGILALDPNGDRQELFGFGCFWAILDEAHITLLGIHPEYQGQGWGKLLLSSLLNKAQEVKMVRATLEVRESNQIAIHLYEQYGFQILGRRKKYYQDTGEDGLIMWRGRLQDPVWELGVESHRG
jgi:ribosomal-protein-alanine N-acetyltransferase